MRRRWIAVLLALGGALRVPAAGKLEVPQVLGPDEALVTVVSQNDLHGGLVPPPEDRARYGAYYWFAGYVAAIRRRASRLYGENTRTVLLDAGDSMQGTLLSNFSEGGLVIDAMNQVGFDAALAGNHGFDFGPVGWKFDRVIPGVTPADPLGALKAAIARAKFPFLGANVYDRSTGERLPELPPYVLLDLPRGRKLAVIGIENPLTARATTPENVTGIQFSSGVKELQKTVEELLTNNAADVFVLLIHQGDGGRRELGEYLNRLPARSTHEPLVDLAIGGHTHQINNSTADGIPYMQSGANGREFGLAELVLRMDPARGRFVVERDRTRTKAGNPIGRVPQAFLGEPVSPDPVIVDLIEKGRAPVESLASQVLATAAGPFRKGGDRTSDFPLGCMLTDLMRESAGTDVALINSGGLRDELQAGPVTYEALYKVLPNNQLMVTMPRLPVSLLVQNLERSVQSCGCRGAMQISGLDMDFFRDCDRESAKARGEDRHARILELRTTGGRVLYRRTGQQVYVDPEPISVAVADFVVEGGAGYPGFPTTVLGPERVPLTDAVAARMRARGTLDPAAWQEGRYHERPIPPELDVPEPPKRRARKPGGREPP